MSYKHGTYGTKEDTYEPTSIAQGTIPVYIGALPIHRANSNGSSNFKYSQYVNTPILISSLREAKEQGLYIENKWGVYTICEAIHAHFMNGDEAVGPIIAVNMFDPTKHVAESSSQSKVTVEKTGQKFIGYITVDAMIEEITLACSTADVTITSQKMYYSGQGIVVEIEASHKNGDSLTSIALDVTSSKFDFSINDITEDDLNLALDSLDYCEQNLGVIPNILVAPGISEKPEFNALLVQKAMDKIASKWNLVCLSDIPSKTVKTYEDAKTWKSDNAVDSKYCKLFWPSWGYGAKTYHGSTIGAYMMQKIDMNNDDVPYVSTSNKEVFCDRATVGSGETLLISEQKANELNQVGITTANIINRTLRIWGAHMANYNHDTVESIAPEERFDTTIRMSMFILNYLQNQYINEIDESFTRKDIDSIVNGIQTWLDSLVNDGMLLFASVSFNNESNSDEAIANGDFVFDINVTYSVNAKSITFKLQYTNTGIATLITSGGEE